MKVKATCNAHVLVGGNVIKIDAGAEYEIADDAAKELIRGGYLEAIAKPVTKKAK